MAGVFNKDKKNEIIGEEEDVRVIKVDVPEEVCETEVVYKVKALGHSRVSGLYNGVRIAGGEEFVLKDKSEFSAIWMEPIGWEPNVNKEFVAKVRDESLSQQNRDYRASRAHDNRETAKTRAMAGEKVSLSQIGGVVKMQSSKPNKKEEVI